MEQIAYNNESKFNALLSDEVVMQWLMDLEAEHEEAVVEAAPERKLHA